MIQLWRITTEVTNTVNDDCFEQTRYFGNKDACEMFEHEQQESVDEWNKPDLGPGGKMSTRYLSTEIEKVEDDTELYGLNMGTLKDIIVAVVWNMPVDELMERNK